jgi:hypothetical protein
MRPVKPPTVPTANGFLQRRFLFAKARMLPKLWAIAAETGVETRFPVR